MYIARKPGGLGEGGKKAEEDLDLFSVRLSSLYTFVAFPLFFWFFSKSSEGSGTGVGDVGVSFCNGSQITSKVIDSEMKKLS